MRDSLLGDTIAPVDVIGNERLNSRIASKIVIVSPGFPALLGGVTDHTARLLQHWSKLGHEVRVLNAPPADLEEVVDQWQQAGVGAVLIQYVPFLYGRLGLSSLPVRIARAARSAGLYVVTFVHEPWVPRSRLPWLVLSPLQRTQLLKLLAECDTYATSVPAWIPLLGVGGHVIYVGSTLGENPAFDGVEPPLLAPTVFSPFASGLRWEWIAAAVQAIGTHPRLTVIGADWDNAHIHPVLRRWAKPMWDWRGYLDPVDVLKLLRRSRLVLAPFEDGLTARRTSPCGVLSTGARLVSSRGHLFDSTFEDGPIVLADSLEHFVDRAVETWFVQDTPDLRQRRLDWYRDVLEPRTWDERLLSLMCMRREQ